MNSTAFWFGLKSFVVVVLLVCTVGLAVSSIPGTQLSGEEIKKLLTGNTIHGVWGSTEYFQFFNSNGTTLYQAVGQSADQGTWSVNTTQYCSRWGGAPSCYDLYQDGKKLLWAVSSATYYSSEVLVGNQLPKAK